MYENGSGGDRKLLALQKQIDNLRDALYAIQAGGQSEDHSEELQNLERQIQQMGERISNLSYASLQNKPRVNNVELSTTTTLGDLGAAASADVPVIGYVDSASATDCTLTSGGYYRLAIPSEIPTGAQIFAIGIVAYTSATGAFYPAPYGSDSAEAYIIGTPSAQIRGLKCRFWYIK